MSNPLNMHLVDDSEDDADDHLLAKDSLAESRLVAQVALNDSEERFKRLSDATLEGVIIHEKGIIIDVNHIIATMFGYEESELIGMYAFDLAAPESHDTLQKNIAAGYEKPYEIVGLRKDRSTFPLETCSRAIPYQGRTVRVGTLRDITERKKAEQSLRDTEQRLFQILEAIPIGVFVTDSTGKGYFANQSAENMLGKGIDPDAKPEDLARTYSAYIAGTPELYPVERMPLVRALAGEHSIVDNMELDRPGGRLLMEVRGAPVYDTEGRVEYAVTAFSDITLRKRDEVMLRELASIVESSSDAILSCSPDGTILAWNRGAERLYGHSRLEVIGKSISLIVPPDLMGNMKGLLDRINSGEDFENIETERLKKDGTRFPVELTLSPTRASDGSVVGYAAIARDITNRKKAEEALRDSEERYISVIATLEEGIAIQRSDGSILAINESTDRILGIPMGQMLSLRSLYTHMRAIREDGAPFTREDDPTVVTLRTGLPCSHVIVGIHRPDNRMVWLSVNTQPLLRPGDAHPYAVVSSLTDITERKQAQEALHEMATRDALTGLFNRREMMRLLDDETVRFRRYGHPASLVMLDVDHFKQVNDTYGHQVGDEVLQWVAKYLQESLRDTDRAARYGGEEFAAILPDTTADGARQIAERLRRGIAATPFITKRADGAHIEIPVTISIGVADVAAVIDAAAEAVIAKADHALYQAKRAGRNRTVAYGQITLATVPLTPQEIVVDRLITGHLANNINSHRDKSSRTTPKLESLVLLL